MKKGCFAHDLVQIALLLTYAFLVPIRFLFQAPRLSRSIAFTVGSFLPTRRLPFCKFLFANVTRDTSDLHAFLAILTELGYFACSPFGPYVDYGWITGGAGMQAN